jgi:MoxR-like ATPase
MTSARQLAATPFYAAQGDECTLFAQAHAARLPLLIKGPTGCGKTRWWNTWPRAWAGRWSR